MAYRLSEKDKTPIAGSESGSSTGDELDERLSDWDSDLGEALVTQSLFDESKHASPEKAIEYDGSKHGVSVREIKTKLDLDVYGLMRLVNLIRKERLSPKQVLELKRDDPRLKEDVLLVPVISDDPLLQLDFDDVWSEDEETPAGPSTATGKESERVKELEAELEKARKDLESMRGLLQTTLKEEGEELDQSAAGTSKSGKGKGRLPAGRDDDTHYFDSYAENDIHEIMLKDTTRTISYARFILSNPAVFRNKIVMDVGCGTGILSMFAAKAGAKQVFAIEASGLAGKARENIRRNGLDGIITVIQGKVEDITLPVKEVDVIISEWMGYMLLYESMLDSVLHARDRYLAPTGLMAPSQTRLVISGITGDEVWKSRVGFWDGVYGFDMTPMDSVYFDEGLVEYVDQKEIVTDEAVVRDINTHSATPKSLDFHSSFELTVQSASTIKAFLTHFDTFFSPYSGPTDSHVPLNKSVDIVKYGISDFGRAVAIDHHLEGPVKISFTTGPKGTETHWRQVVFLLRHGLEVKPGQRVTGGFYCRKSVTNSRELDVEVHYGLEGSEERWVQVYKVR